MRPAPLAPVVASVARRLATAVLLLPAVAAGAAAQTRPAAPAPAASAPATVTSHAPALVFVVRHAEKAPGPGDDPALSAAGRARAAALGAALAQAGVQAIIVTPRRRTAETAAPTAAARGLVPEVVPFAATVEAHAAAVAAAVAAAARRHAGGVVLVVGHSNTVPAVVAALGGPRLPDLCDASYATLFVVRPATGGAAASVARVTYGAADPPAAAACAGMTAR